MKTNFISLFAIAIVVASCSTSQMASKQVDDDVYFSTKDLKKTAPATAQTSEQSDYVESNQTQTNSSTSTTSSDDYYDKSYSNHVTGLYNPYGGYGYYNPCYTSAFGYPSNYYGSGLSISLGYNYSFGNGLYMGIGNSWGYNPYGSYYGGYNNPYMSYNNAFWNGYYSGVNSNYYGNYYSGAEYGNRYYGARKTLAANSNVVSKPSGRMMRAPIKPIEIKTVGSKELGNAERPVNTRGGKPVVKTEEKKSEKGRFDIGKVFNQSGDDNKKSDKSRNTNIQSTPTRQSNPQPSRSVSAPRRR